MESTKVVSVGVDIGGTFTDFISIDSCTGSVRTAKVPTTLDDRANGFIAGIEKMDVDFTDIEWIVHGTTAGTNAVLEHNGAKLGLITSRGFRDVPELGRRERPHLYGLTGEFLPLVPRNRRLEVRERISATGEVLIPLDKAEVQRVVQELLELGAEALVIHFMNSYVNPAHEQECFKIAKDLWPTNEVVAGHHVMREIREYERVSTAMIHASIQSIVSGYTGRVASRLKDKGCASELLIMQGNGGMMAASVVAENAAQTVMSGPAAGVLAASAIAKAAGCPNAITCDMGGTSFDVALIADGAPTISNSYEIEHGVPIAVPMMDIHTIGSGGGSIAWIDQADMLRVGPESAGSYPGPVGYGRGGQRPTVTDANYLLRRLEPGSVTGTDKPADLEAIAAAMDEHIGSKLGLSPLECAEAILTVASNDMAQAARLVSVEQGHDPRDFVLFPFGGAGPLHAVSLARQIGIPSVLVPRFPGLTSALGCVYADVRHTFVRTVDLPFRDIDSAEIDRVYDEQITEARALLEKEAVPVSGIEFLHEADIYYRGQSHTLRIQVDYPDFDCSAVEKAFIAKSRDRYQIVLDEMQPVILNLRTTIIGRRDKPDFRLFAQTEGGSLEEARVTEREVYFDGAWRDTAIYERGKLPIGARLPGPAIVMQMDSTIVIDPGSSCLVDELANLLISVNA